MVYSSEFNVTDAVYKTVDGHDIELSILTAKDLPSGLHPVIVRFHGGFLVTGARMFEAWCQRWIMAFAKQSKAILITPDYRLMPEASGADILSDVASLFKWLHTDLQSKLPAGIEADLTSILTTGESAGGYLSVQSALLHRDAGVKAAISAYGVLDTKTRFFTEAFDKPIVGRPMVDAAILDEHLRKLRAGGEPKVVSTATPPERMDLTMCVVQQGRYVELLGEGSELYAMENLDARADGEVPPLWLFHGRDDTAVPVEGSEAFTEKLKKLHPSTDVLLTLEPGEHGFDRETPLDTPWLANGLEFISKHWP